MKCVFCKLISNSPSEDTVFQDEKVLVMLDADWAVKGHTLVIWKRHFENLSELPLEDYLYFSKIVHRTEKALLGILNVDKSIILKSGTIVSHFHFHIYPVRKNIKWETVKDIFSKKVRYKPKSGEKQKLVADLREKLSTITPL